MNVVTANFLGNLSYIMLCHSSKVLPPRVAEAIRKAAEAVARQGSAGNKT